MNIRFIVPLLLAAAFAFACGPRSHSSEPSTVKVPEGGSPVASSLNVSVGREVEFSFHVTNNGTKRLELVFPSGQTHDIIVMDSTGREVWRWSDGRMFTQSLQNRVLASNQTLSLQEKWKPAKAVGTFTAVARLKSENFPLEQRVEFTLP